MKKLITSFLLMFCVIAMIQAAPIGTCPAVTDPDNPVYLPDDTECKVYYVCTDGIPVPTECGPNTFWNCEENVCVFPEQMPDCECFIFE